MNTYKLITIICFFVVKAMLYIISLNKPIINNSSRHVKALPATWKYVSATAATLVLSLLESTNEQ